MRKWAVSNCGVIKQSYVNAHQTLVAVKHDGLWRIQLFQNTPAQFHGRPELVQHMTEELRQVLEAETR